MVMSEICETCAPFSILKVPNFDSFYSGGTLHSNTRVVGDMGEKKIMSHTWYVFTDKVPSNSKASWKWSIVQVFKIFIVYLSYTPQYVKMENW